MDYETVNPKYEYYIINNSGKNKKVIIDYPVGKWSNEINRDISNQPNFIGFGN